MVMLHTGTDYGCSLSKFGQRPLLTLHHGFAAFSHS